MIIYVSFDVLAGVEIVIILIIDEVICFSFRLTIIKGVIVGGVVHPSRDSVCSGFHRPKNFFVCKDLLKLLAKFFPKIAEELAWRQNDQFCLSVQGSNAPSAEVYEGPTSRTLLYMSNVFSY